jgi:hypothetical protein
VTALKAIVAALIAFVGGLAGGATDGHLTLAEWLVAASAGLVALGGVFQVKNAPKAATKPGDSGLVDVAVLLLVVILVVVLVLLFHGRIT